MKIQPENKKSNRKYPSLKDYKKKFMITTFTVGIALSPIVMSSCNSKTENIQKTSTQNNKNVDLDKTKIKKEEKVEKPQRLGGIAQRIDDEKIKPELQKNKEPCDTDIPTKEKTNNSKTNKKVKDEKIKKPNKKIKKPNIRGGRHSNLNNNNSPTTLNKPKKGEIKKTEETKKDDKKDKDALKTPTKPHKLRGKVKLVK